MKTIDSSHLHLYASHHKVYRSEN